MKPITKKWAWFIAIWFSSVFALTMFAYLLRFIIN
ncbi:hypothetical protein DS885_08150 [Psychromonas sp. B3M02]|nr:hypothetical protein DS885_08150 [Psychromonas sp. B3M02]